MSRTHTLKIADRFYERLESGQKTNELRKNDRDFQVGDYVHFEILWENDPTGSPILGNSSFNITHVLQAYKGLEEGYCILSLKKHEDE